MLEKQQISTSRNKRPRSSELRELRLKELMDGSRQEVLRQIIGPFGLTPAMFDDKAGGNVSTVHNAEQSIFANEQDRENYSLANKAYSQEVRQKHLDDRASRGNAHREFNRVIDSGGVVYCAATHRPMSKGQINGDHVVSLKELHGNKHFHLHFSEEERKKIANSPKNLAYIEASLNKSKREKSWAECYGNPEFVKRHNLTPDNIKGIKGVDEAARRQVAYKVAGKVTMEIGKTGATEAGRNALRQALGVLLYEFVNGSYLELKRLVSDRENSENLIDRVVQSLRRVMDRVIRRMKCALEAAVQGGAQAFLSNLLTFLINNLITTSKKLVMIIREGMGKLCEAIKMVISPPDGMSAMDVARNAAKLIAAVVTMGIGLAMEESVKVFISSIPILVPIAGLVATALTAIMTGLCGAIVIYGIDRIFDWLSSTGTELLEALEASSEQLAEAAIQVESLLQLQYENSRLYTICAHEYQLVQASYSSATANIVATVANSEAASLENSLAQQLVEEQLDRKRQLLAAFGVL